MRRKSERAKASPSVKQSENVPRRTTRRNKKSPEKSFTEEDSENSSSHGSESEKEEREVLPTRRAKRQSRVEKPTVDEVKVRPTRGKRKTSVRSNEANEHGEILDVTPRPDIIQEEVANDAAEATVSHDNGSNFPVKDGEEKKGNNNSDDDDNDGDDSAPPPDAKKQPKSQSDDNIQNNQPNSDAELEEPQTTTTNYSDVVQTQQNRDVIPEDTDDAVDVASTVESESSSNHKHELNDFSATDVVASNKTNNISERTDDAARKDEKDAAAKKDRKKYEGDTKRQSDADGSRESSEDRSAVKNKETEKSQESGKNDHVKNNVADNDTEKENSGESNAQKPIVRKRKWLSTKNTTSRTDEFAISSDSLKGLIPDVKPVPLSDINLESNSEPEIEVATNEIESESEEERNVTRTIEVDLNRRSEERVVTLVPVETTAGNTNSSRKVSIVPDTNLGHPPSPPKSSPSCILYITNLVRPFTLMQLRGLLSRTGKIVENGFWMDKIKSKCYVKFETEDEAVETRHALHGVQWPNSNPKCLNVDFGSESQMERAVESTNEDGKRTINLRDERGHHPWDRTEGEREKILAAEKPIREWDLGKKTDTPRRGREAERDEHTRINNDRERVERNERSERIDRNDRTDRERERTERERSERGERGERTDRNDRRKRSAERRKHSESLSPGRKYAKKDNEPPLRLLDDLFRKTKSTPCIYWLPLTPEQITVKEEIRQKQLAEHQRRIDALKKERIERGNVRDQGRDQRRRGNSRSSRERDRGGRRRR